MSNKKMNFWWTWFVLVSNMSSPTNKYTAHATWVNALKSIIRVKRCKYYFLFYTSVQRESKIIYLLHKIWWSVKLTAYVSQVTNHLRAKIYLIYRNLEKCEFCDLETGHKIFLTPIREWDVHHFFFHLYG